MSYPNETYSEDYWLTCGGIDDCVSRESLPKVPRSPVAPVILLSPYIFLRGRPDCYRFFFREDRVDFMDICSTEALAFYNKENGTDYTFEDYVDIVCHHSDEFWVHCNFTAKPIEKPLKHEDFEPKLFFAELHRVSWDEGIQATACHMLEGCDTKVGCENCPKAIIHPPSGFHLGIKPR